MASKKPETLRERLANLFKKYIGEWDPFYGLDPTKKEGLVPYLGEFGISRGLVIACFFLGFLAILSIEVPNLHIFIFGWLAGTAPIWLPVAIYIGAWKAWVNYARSSYIFKLKTVVLEVRIPREITKSPRAMEQIFANLGARSGEVTFLNRGWTGAVRPWFSFEVASFGGEIHFY